MSLFTKTSIALVAATIFIVVSRGLAVSLIWNLFVPEFFGMPKLPVLIAIALSTLLSVMIPTVAPVSNKNTEYSELYRMLFIAFLAPWFGYLFALVTTSIYF